MQIKLSSRLFTAGISEKKKQWLLDNTTGLEPEKLDELLKLDPSPDSRFIQWLIKHKDEVDAKITGHLTELMRLAKNPQWMADDRNFGSWSVEKLLQTVEKPERLKRKEWSKGERERVIMEKGIPGPCEMIVNDGTWKVWRVKNVKDEQFLSSGSGWCTTQEHYARDYIAAGPVYPVYKHNKPFAQGHVGSMNRESGMAAGQFVILNKNDEKFQMNEELLELMEVIRPLPDFHFF